MRLSLILLAIPTLALAQEPISHQAAQRLAQATFAEYLELLALPNDAINPPDIQKNVDFLERAFKKRGFVTKQLENKGSGHFGNYVPNPAVRLSRLIASMKDDEGRVTVAGYYDRIKLSDAEKKILADTGDDEAAICRRTGIKLAELVGGNLQEAIQFPSLNFRGPKRYSGGASGVVLRWNSAMAWWGMMLEAFSPPEAAAMRIAW